MVIVSFLVACLGNCLGEEGCEALREVIESMNMEDLLGSLRYLFGVYWIIHIFLYWKYFYNWTNERCA